MKIIISVILAFGIFAFFSINTFTADAGENVENLSVLLQEITTKNLNGLNKKEIDLAMSAIHPQSPVYDRTKLTTEQIYTKYNLQYKLISLRVIGTDGEYAVARVKQAATRVDGPEFKDQIVDLMYNFRKESGVWKVWTTSVLEIDYQE